MMTSLARRGLIYFVFLSGLLYLFYPGLINSQVPAFRDAYHFYYPQALWLDQCAQRGEYFPLWNPNEGLGSSVAGQTSSALFYPLRILWHLPWLSVAQRFSVVIVVHLVIAALGMRLAAGKLGLSKQAAQLAAVSYGLSCPVLFQHCNLIYLCSAAWIGFALAAIIETCRMPGRNEVRTCVVFASAVCMMLLGGDPHTAVNAMIVATVALAANVWRLSWQVDLEARFANGSTAFGRVSIHGLRSARWLCLAFGMVIATTAIQWLPAMHWVQSSARGSKGQGESYQAQSLTLQELESMAGAVAPPVHRVYDFSLPPWHAATLLWPTLGGNYLPSHSRWLAMVPAEGRMWQPSLYFGFLPCLLFLGAFRKTASSRVRWLLGFALLAWLAAMGNYSLIWVLKEILVVVGLPQYAKGLPADHVGSLYACLTWLVPGYDGFRYPAKWTPWIMAAGSLIASMRLDECAHEFQFGRILPRVFRPLFFCLCGLICLAALWLGVGGLQSKYIAWSDVASDPWMGRPEYQAICWALLFAALVPCVCWAVIARVGSAWRNWIVLLTIIEMTLVASQWTSFVVAPTRLGQFDQELTDASTLLVWADNSEADIWNDQLRDSQQPFLTDQAQYQNTFLLGKLASVQHARSLVASQSIKPRFAQQLVRWLASHDDFSPEQPRLDEALSLIGVSHRLVRLADQPQALHWQSVPNPQPLCQAWDRSDSAASSQGELKWSWPTSSELEVTARSPNNRILLVRQFNDGGWTATLYQDDSTSEALEIKSSIGSLLELEIPAGSIRINLQRKWFW